jgi:uncharacterized membrane protein YdjX (TVP38/TMEM64 family)
MQHGNDAHPESDDPPQTAPSRHLKRKSILVRILFIVVVIGVLAVAGRWFGTEIEPFENWIRSLGYWGPLIFCLVFIVITGLQLPESLLAIAAGVAFGLVEGLVILVAINIIGAILWFWIARKFLRNWVHSILSRHPKMEAIENATAMEGFKLIVLLRMGPFSYGGLNLMLGASDVRFWPYCFALIGVIPGNFATVYFGSMAKHVASKAADADNLSNTHFVIMAIGFTVTIGVVAYIAHVARGALKKYQLEVSAEPAGA